MDYLPPYPHSHADFVVKNRRAVPFAGCVFHAFVWGFLPFCIINIWVGLAYVVVMLVSMTFVYPRLVSGARLWERLTLFPGDHTFRVSHLVALIIGPDPREDYAEAGRLFRLTIIAHAGETYRLMIIGEDARRVLEWGNARHVVVMNECDQGP
jgi:hypothetical protein